MFEKVCSFKVPLYICPTKTEKMATLKTTLGLRNNPDVLTSRDAAFRWAANCNKLHIVMLGDNEQFWVVCLSDAARLLKAGYEIAA